MKVILLLLMTVAFGWNINDTNQLSDFKGKWHSERMDNMVVYVYKAKNGYWYGKIVDSDNKKNIGKLMLKKMSPNKAKTELTGKVRKPETGFEAEVMLKLADKNNLKMKTYIFWTSRTFDLKRLE